MCRPKNPEELFNLRHAQLRNVIERIFGVFKNRFMVLVSKPAYSLKTQAKLVSACAAVHNFIGIHDPSDPELLARASDTHENTSAQLAQGFGDLGTGVTTAERTQVMAARDLIARNMWTQYQEELARRAGMNLE